ncbi:putative cystathionine beta-lyase [Hyaloraphidium curvatum]|nr:putative cystathionine beta-lyase [Hyaloraphidium curvatum]
MEPATQLIVGGRSPFASVATVNPPVFRGSTVVLDTYEELRKAAAGTYDGVSYGTERFPAQRMLEDAMRGLEGAALTRAFPSGIAAIQHALMAFTKAGDHVVLCDNAYSPGRSFARSILSKFGIEVGSCPSAVGADLVEYLKPNTVLVLLESPGSNTFEIQDLRAVAAVCRDRGIVSILDNTWATPFYLDAFGLGLDATIHSVTKYISGHSDVLLGTVSVGPRLAPILDDYYKTCELFAPFEDCHLALRGLRTLQVRLKQHESSALEIARWLEGVDLVGEVIHPALPAHPQHELWKRDFTGSSGLFAFTFKADHPDERIAAFMESLRLFRMGFSWGGFQSLVTAGRYRREHGSQYEGRTVVRLSVGLEDPRDLTRDLEQAMANLR